MSLLLKVIFNVNHKKQTISSYFNFQYNLIEVLKTLAGNDEETRPDVAFSLL